MHIVQWNSKEKPEINPNVHGELVFDKCGKNIPWGKTVLTDLRKNGYPYAE